MEQETADASVMVQEDRSKIYNSHAAQSMTVENAIERALKYNLDARIARYGVLSELSAAQLQKLNSLPDVKAQRDYIKRSNNGASSSQSVLTGNQSLEPSFSADRSRQTDLLEANWDVLDAAINIYTSKSASDKAKIAEQRYRKVEQNIAMDVFSSFYRVAIAQQMETAISSAITQADKTLASLAIAQKNGDLPLSKVLSMQEAVLDKKSQLLSLKKQMELSKIELKALLSIAPTENVILEIPNNWADPKNIMQPTKAVNTYVDEALFNRPEIREEFYNKNIARRDVVNSILQTIPGFSVIASLNQDDNSFLQEDDWFSFSATVTQSITKLLTLPFRYDRAKTEQGLVDAKRYALIAAVISQVHISKSLFDQKQALYDDAHRRFSVQQQKYAMSKASKDAGLIGGAEFASAELDFLISQHNTYSSYSDAQASLAGFVNTVGYDVKDFYNITDGFIEKGGAHG